MVKAKKEKLTEPYSHLHFMHTLAHIYVGIPKKIATL